VTGMFQERQKSDIGRGTKMNDPTPIELPKGILSSCITIMIFYAL